MKLDAFCHVMPKKYADRLAALGDVPAAANVRKRIAGVPSMVDLDLRFRQLEEFGDDYRQIISLPAPAVEDLGPPAVSRDFARLGNEGLAELVHSHPDRFAGFVACLPMNDPDGAVEEIEYACGALGALGVQFYTHVNGHPLDEERFEPLYAKLADLDRMIWVHPCRNSSWADYPTEDRSRYEIWWVLGWEYDTAVFMARIVFGGVLERYPTLKVLIHHGGSMIPHFAGRVGPGWDQLGSSDACRPEGRRRALPALEAAHSTTSRCSMPTPWRASPKGAEAGPIETRQRGRNVRSRIGSPFQVWGKTSTVTTTPV